MRILSQNRRKSEYLKLFGPNAKASICKVQAPRGPTSRGLALVVFADTIITITIDSRTVDKAIIAKIYFSQKGHSN